MRVRDLMEDQLREEEAGTHTHTAEEAWRSQRNPDDLKVTGLSEQTLDEIDALFPELAPDPMDSEREVWMKAGERRLVRFLIAQYRLAHGITETQ